MKLRREGLYDPEFEHDACGVGFVAHIKGQKSRSIVEQGLEILRRLSHRGACGADPDTGDGAGILMQLPHRFFKAEGLRLGFDMPRRRRYAIAMVFLPADPANRRYCEDIFEQVVEDEGQRVLGWRDVPVNPAHTGRLARSVMPTIRQLYIGRRRVVPSAFERKLFIIRKLTENRIRESGADPEGFFHVASCSAETIVYKGLLLSEQLPNFYPDLQHREMVSALALVHSRFSTNTFPTWDLAQPFRFLAHNGEINTLRGNRNWMNARKSQLGSAKFGGNLDRLFPVIVPGKSDSAQFDNMLELLVLAGRTLPQATMMMIPEAYENDGRMDDERRAFYEYSGTLMEPWDGPAAIAFTDGHVIGATLDRNGLRPARYLITNDDRVVLASETGVMDVDPSNVKAKGRLQPGRMLLVDTTEGRIIDDSEAKAEIAQRWPYRRWLKKNVFSLSKLPDVPPSPPLSGPELVRLQRAMGWTDEDLRVVIGPMANDGKEPTGSMGNDAPLAVLSRRAPVLFDYFHQLFAQVTNPPIDPIRENLVMTLHTAIGPDGNTLEETPEQCHRVTLPGPVVDSQVLEKLKGLQEGAFEPMVLSTLYDADSGPQGLERAVERLCFEACEAVDDGCNLLIVSDRGVDSRRVAIPALLALSAVHHHLVREGTRMQAGLIIETAEAREVHHIALLIGYGAAAVNPYLALDTVRTMVADGRVQGPEEEALKRYKKAIDKGLMKVMSKMGISTLQSYRGAQIFEALGLNRRLIERHFTGTPSRLEGIGLQELGREVLERHQRGFSQHGPPAWDELPEGGIYQWRRRGEHHAWNPQTLATLQWATKRNDRELFREFSSLADEEPASASQLRGLLAIKTLETPLPLDEVEPVTEILKRFATGAMSFGSISAEAHETLAIAMNRMGGKSNSGEGGEEARRFEPDPNGDWRRSAIKQVASARFGVTTHYLVNADELQIKMAQGAKPGEGGQLPGHKVDDRIARVRHATPGVTLISPPPHHDIYSIEDLAQLIFDLKSVNPAARVSVKLVSEVGVGTVAAGVAKAGAGAVVIAGHSGGTGASPLSSVRYTGLPWELGLAETQQVLVANSLRERVRVQVDGGVRTARDVVVAALLGAEEFGVSTAALVAMGCIMLRKCHLNTCSVGIATQDPELRKRFAGQPEVVVNYFTLLAEEVRMYMAQMGFRTFDEMVGQVDRLERAELGPENHFKRRTLDLDAILHRAGGADAPRRCSQPQDPVGAPIDEMVLARAEDTLNGGRPVQLELPIANTDRTVGARLSGAIALKHPRGLPDDAIVVRFTGSAGQSFGAFLTAGVRFDLVGDCNDYVGKGLSGGRLSVTVPPGTRYEPESNIIIGNTALYGATGGELYANGAAGERFAVRNSGARAVVEGAGDHACEYMTGGVVVVLGRTGRNFGAGMSGGMAFVFDRDRQFRSRVNMDMVELESLVNESDIWLVHGMISDHVRYTNSRLGQRILDNWHLMVSDFVKVMPIEYKRALQAARARRDAEFKPAIGGLG